MSKEYNKDTTPNLFSSMSRVVECWSNKEYTNAKGRPNQFMNDAISVQS